MVTSMLDIDSKIEQVRFKLTELKYMLQGIQLKSVEEDVELVAIEDKLKVICAALMKSLGKFLIMKELPQDLKVTEEIWAGLVKECDEIKAEFAQLDERYTISLASQAARVAEIVNFQDNNAVVDKMFYRMEHYMDCVDEELSILEAYVAAE